MSPQTSSSFHARPVAIRGDELHALHAYDPQRFPALLASTANHARLGRYDILFAHPTASLVLRGDGRLHSTQPVSQAGFLSALDECWRAQRSPMEPGMLPFRGGWLLYLSYELAEQIEPKVRLTRDANEIVALAMRVPMAIVRDCTDGRAWIVAEHGHEIEATELERELRSVAWQGGQQPQVHNLREEAPIQFIEAVERCLEYIRAGDIYQANLSRRWQAEVSKACTATDLFLRLRRTNPAPFAALAQFEGLGIASSSPERLLEVRDGWIASRPIAGTRPRADGTTSDAALIRELQEHPKERAEHIMLIDLERNDLGRLCVPGSVEVDEYMSIETYAHVHHIVSNVRGRLRAAATPGEIIAAMFPGGTITGCPKVRCMQIISELERSTRGPYTGSIGYLNRDGSMDLNILIRTLEIRGQALSFRAGAGIVADSIAQREVAETRAKARGLLRALEVSS